jgi:RHS repeat-associated protein
MTTTKSYDNLNRLLRTASVPSASSALRFDFQLNAANQRTRVTHADGSYWIYEYDSIGQLKTGKHYWSDGTPVAGQQNEYAFDDIGNRTSTKEGGDASGANLRAATYGANNLNQYTNRTVPGAADILGIAHAAATVTVNNSATYRRGEYYDLALSINNASAAIWQSVTNLASLGGTNNTVTGNVFLPKTPEVFAFDADGNLTQDGRWDMTWDGENRLTRIVGISTLPDAARLSLDCGYDYQSRRISKTVSNWTGSAWSFSYSQKFVYDGWNLVAILDQNNTLLYSFSWGTDASGSMQGAGGVGGLISMTVHSGANAGTYFYSYDGNGNVAALVNAADGTIAARYEYDPFGNLIRATGALAFINPYRFSTKFCDDETGFYYYGYRYYDPRTGRWLNRDPMEEKGGINLYGFALGNAISHADFLGLGLKWKLTPRDTPESDPKGGLRTGFTQITDWETPTKLKKCSGGCGFKVVLGKVKGAGTSWWWTLEDWEAHEAHHRADDDKSWDWLYLSIQEYLNVCVSERKAKAYQLVVTWHNLASLGEAIARGAEYDCATYGKADPSVCKDADERRASANSSWDILAQVTLWAELGNP